MLESVEADEFCRIIAEIVGRLIRQEQDAVPPAGQEEAKDASSDLRTSVERRTN